MEGPVTIRPSNVSTTPLTFLICSSISGAVFFNQAMSVEKILISIGLGDQVRSPIRSPRMPGKSQSIAGHGDVELVPQLGDDFFGRTFSARLQLDEKIAGVRLGDGRSARRAPVRRE